VTDASPTVLAVIPARDGSKGLPGKNTRLLAGKPLLVWSIEQALASAAVTVVHVSTDSAATADIARAAGADVPYLRPGRLATDEATTQSVIEYALDHYATGGSTFDYVVLVEPTSPLRERDDIDRAITTLQDNADSFDSLVTLGPVQAHPSITKRLAGSRVVPFFGEVQVSSRRQDLDPAFFPYGVAYVAKTKTLLDEGTFYTSRCMGMLVERHQAYEIDDVYDFLCVEAILSHRSEAS
jgi:CMP-N-acetylneuraminic acid synthetase